MRRLVAKHSLPTRILHWLNVPVLATLVYSGIAISDAKKDPYKISIGGHTLLTVFHEDTIRNWGMPVPPRALAWHFTFIWFYVSIGVLYVGWTLFSGSWRELIPRRGGLRAAWHVFIHDLRSSSPMRATDGRYNAAQRLAYTLALLILFGLFLSGLAIYRPTQLSLLTQMMGGYKAARAVHFWLTFALCTFVAIHVLQVARAGWNTFRAMIIGVEVVEIPETAHAKP
jgi:thiosulfate reductase cytochrome b subunit